MRQREYSAFFLCTVGRPWTCDPHIPNSRLGYRPCAFLLLPFLCSWLASINKIRNLRDYRAVDNTLHHHGLCILWVLRRVSTFNTYHQSFSPDVCQLVCLALPQNWFTETVFLSFMCDFKKSVAGHEKSLAPSHTIPVINVAVLCSLISIPYSFYVDRLWGGGCSPVIRWSVFPLYTVFNVYISIS